MLATITLALFAVLLGVAFCFAGYRFFLVMLPIWGFFAGFWLGAQTTVLLFGDGFLATTTGWVVGFVAGIIFWGGFNTAMEMTNNEQFCISCHEMEDYVFQEYKDTIHYANRTGVRATCPDCHVPKEWHHKVVRKIQRKLIGYATDIEVDASGRVLLSAPLRNYAKLEKKVVLIGQGNKFEIWDAPTWAGSREDWLAEANDSGSELSEQLAEMVF